MFQSPSLRGSGLFNRSEPRASITKLSFNPLHCGAVVSSRRYNRFAPAAWRASFNPLHCGAVVASKTHWNPVRFQIYVSIPFIAGQWSLRGARHRVCRVPRRVSIPFIAGQWSLRRRWRHDGGARPLVSIPFIAGQWSLHVAEARAEAYRNVFQSPSLRGSGRFDPGTRGGRPRRSLFQSPSLRGSGRFGSTPPDPIWIGEVSIPFIAGQWSLLP